MTRIPDKFPKIQCPYERESETDASKSYITENLKSQYEWIFDSDTTVIEKLHGTNVAVYLEHNNVKKVAVRHGNRDMNELNPFGSTAHQSITRGIQNAINSGFLYQFKNDWVFGEVVGPSFQGNPYELSEDLFIPFDWIREHCTYNDFPLDNDLSKIQHWMSDTMYSHFKARMDGMNPTEASVSNGYFVEGVVFVSSDLEARINPIDLETFSTEKYDSTSTQLAKIRRDMFESIDVKSEFPNVDI